ncbi:hypothetical protein GCM10007860_24510 [Chitiniphilus shinanonensis]|uniref:Outer membrane lipoprotein n=1 Tax=Chitiniphilus shinanonensis TaxID=553088 RepID=A0ABQ6BU66_9NEIS|nr:hypothetical protein [Chitiniphilus shinanonensis]GLS05301.1 hypothetical protein GCM10007860_24510 [Chitiniphilus shinanonensis]
MEIKQLCAIVMAGAVLVLGGCATSDSANVYKRSQMRTAATVQSGVVEQVREVRMEDSTGVGAVAGGAIGGIAAAGNIGGGNGQIVSGIIGSIIGGLLGNKIEESVMSKQALEVTVLLDNGQRMVVVQEADQPIIARQRVNLISDGQTTRVVPSNEPFPATAPEVSTAPMSM